MASQGGERVQGSSWPQVMSVASTPDSERDGFNVSYGSKAPPPPPS